MKKAQQIKHLCTAKFAIIIAILVLVLSIILAVVSLYPIYTGDQQTRVLVNDTFRLSPNEIYRQGLGSFHSGEKVSVLIQSPTAFQKNFSIVTYNGLHYSNSSESDISYSFSTGADFYDTIVTSNSSYAGTIHFQASVEQPKTVFPYSWLNEASKIMFVFSLALTMLLMLKQLFSKSKVQSNSPILPSISKRNRQYILLLLVISLLFWLFLLAINSNPLATFEGWYTDNARHSYTASLFFKDGFSVFNQPLGNLASPDNSYFKFVTWPEMPHLYPLGSIFLFLPFGALIQNGFNANLTFKIEIATFLLFATICIYFFLKYFLRKDQALLLKLIGVYIIYVSLLVYAADGMFDSIAFLFSLFAVYMFMMERYDYFFLLVSVSIFFKYQAGIFLFPLIIVGLINLFQKNKLNSLLKNKAVLAGATLGSVSILTAALSAPYFLATTPQLIMNGINAFSPNSQIPWTLQSLSVVITLVATLAYAVYMFNKNNLLSLSAFFLLLPSFMLPYFQNWYLPFFFIYALIPQQKKELEVTMLWLIFMIFVLSFGGVAFSPLQIFAGLKTLLNL